MMKVLTVQSAILVLLLGLGARPATAFQDRVATLVAALSGDTIEIRYEGASGIQPGDIVTLRLFGIRCPQPGKPFGDEARDIVARAAGSRLLIGTYVDDGSFGVDVALVGYPVSRAMTLFEPHIVDERDSVYYQEELLKAGLAETDSAVCRGRDRLDAKLCEEWKALERHARVEGKGMWGKFKQPVE